MYKPPGGFQNPPERGVGEVAIVVEAWVVRISHLFYAHNHNSAIDKPPGARRQATS